MTAAAGRNRLRRCRYHPAPVALASERDRVLLMLTPIHHNTSLLLALSDIFVLQCAAKLPVFLLQFSGSLIGVLKLTIYLHFVNGRRKDCLQVGKTDFLHGFKVPNRRFLLSSQRNFQIVSGLNAFLSSALL